MKGLLSLLMVVALPLAALAAPQEGQHYRELPFPQTVESGDKIEVREFFWYGCPVCYRLEPHTARWMKNLPPNVQYVRTPGVAPRWLVHAQAFYAFESLGALDKVHDVFFEAIHVKKLPLNDEESLARFAAEHGIERDKFLQTFRSFGVRMKVERAKQLNVAYMVNSVPTLVVDGRYMTSPAMAGGEEAAMQVVDFLIKRAQRERRAGAGKGS